MGRSTPLVTAVGARRLVSGLGAVFVVTVASYPFLPIVDDATVELWIVLGILVGVPGLVLVYGGYRLPRTEIRPEFYATVATWCLRGFVVGLAVMAPIVVASSNSNVFPNSLLLTALGSLAGFGAGSYDARAKTGKYQLHETIDRLETSNERLERHRAYTDDILDSIDDVFYVLNEAGDLERWNQSLAAVTGYTNEEIVSMTAGDFFADDHREAAVAAIRDGFERGSVHVELDLRTKDGDMFPFEFVASTVEAPSGETVLAGIGRDVSDRVEREQRLEELVDKLEASNERLEQFAYAASHDLQEPLRMVSSYLQLIEQRYEEDLDEEGRELLEFAVDGADRMRAMIDGLLQYSRVETQGKSLQPVDLDEVVADVLDDLDVRFSESDAEVNCGELPRVNGDESQLRQVFQNLLDNAIEYSGDEPPRIRISAERTSSEWRVSVTDEGVGIDPGDRERIFEVFERLHGRGDYEGSGIGLALCERIVERHGGEIWVESEPGETSTFSFTLQPAAEQENA